MLNSIVKLFAAIGDTCNPTEGASSFLGLPHWFEYLDGERDAFGKCIPSFDWGAPGDLWGIALASIDILLRLIALVAVGFIIYGGFQYMTSTGEPEKTKAAKETILNALIGATIAIAATAIVSFLGNNLRG